MRIASEIPNYGTEVFDDLKVRIKDLIIEETITQVIETGTYKGTGTTRAVLDGMMAHGFEYEFISIEVNPQYASEATINNIHAKGLTILNGLSVGRPDLPTDTTFNVPDHIIVDHDPAMRSKLYKKEVQFNVPDRMLAYAIQKMGGKPEMVILDSAGHMGFIEFKYLMDRVGDHSFYLVLDDIGHVKHYNSYQYVLSHPEQFEVLWESESVHKSAIIKVL
jgi:hypothetical protein